AAGKGVAERNRILSQYARARDAVNAFSRSTSNRSERSDRTEPPAAFVPEALPDGLPPEFADYMAGLMAMHAGRVGDARAAWMRLLDRPREQRALRSTWAAYMLGKSFMAEDPAAARKWFARTRTLAAEGY